MTEKHPVDTLQLLSFLCGDCDEHTSERIRTHLSSCASCRGRLETFSAQRRAFLDSYPHVPSPVAPRSMPAQWQRRRVWALAATLVFLVAGVLTYQRLHRVEGYRLKGDEVDVHIYVMGESGVAEQRRDQVYYPGERIQMTYSCGARNHFLLFGIDQRGTVTTYYPLSGESSMLLAKGQGLPLPHSIELDSYTGRESYVAVFSGSALTAETLRAHLERAATVDGDSLKAVVRAVNEQVSVRVLTITKKERAQ